MWSTRGFLPPLVDLRSITRNRAPHAAASLLCNRALRGGRPAPNGTLLVHTPTYSNRIWIYNIFQLSQPVATTIPHQKKSFAPIIVLCIFTNTTAALNVHSNLPPCSTASPRITTTAITSIALPPPPSSPPPPPSTQCHGLTLNPFPSRHPGQAIPQHLQQQVHGRAPNCSLRTRIPPQAPDPSALVPVPPPRYRRPPSALALASNWSSLPSSPPGPRSDSLPILKDAILFKLMVRWW